MPEVGVALQRVRVSRTCPIVGIVKVSARAKADGAEGEVRSKFRRVVFSPDTCGLVQANET